MGAELFVRTDRQTDGQTDMTKIIVAFRNFANAPKDVLVVHGDISAGGKTREGNLLLGKLVIDVLILKWMLKKWVAQFTD
jgi:hypothetical protein